MGSNITGILIKGPLESSHPGKTYFFLVSLFCKTNFLFYTVHLAAVKKSGLPTPNKQQKYTSLHSHHAWGSNFLKDEFVFQVIPFLLHTHNISEHKMRSHSANSLKKPEKKKSENYIVRPELPLGRTLTMKTMFRQ